MQKKIWKKGAVCGIIFLFLGTNIVSGIDLINQETINEVDLQQPNGYFSGKVPRLQVVSHLATQEEINDFKNHQNNIDICVDESLNNDTDNDEEYANGVVPLSDEEWDSMVGTMKIIDKVEAPVPLQSFVDLSLDPCFPAVGNQGVQSSCVAWAAAYYTNGFLQAKNHGWTDASEGNPNHLLSPGFVFNKARDWTPGSQPVNIYKVLSSLGTCRLVLFPYDPYNNDYFGDESSWRDAVQYRVDNVYTFSHSPIDITSIKNAIYNQHPVTFTINPESWIYCGDDFIMNSLNMKPYDLSTEFKHEVTLVGYDDNKVDTETGEVGAFKIVNSQGTVFKDNGFVWITYEAFGGAWNTWPINCCDVKYEPPEHPKLLAVVQNIESGDRRKGFDIWIGNIDSMELSTWEYLDYYEPRMLPDFMCWDITDFYDTWASGTTDFHLENYLIKDGGQAGELVKINDFFIEYYKDEYVPGSPFHQSEDAIKDSRTTPFHQELIFSLVHNQNQGKEYPLIQQAIDDANPGDIIEVYPGTYEENIVIDKSLSLISRNASTTCIQGDDTGPVVTITADGVNFSDFVIETPWHYDTGILIDSNYNIITGNIVRNNKVGIAISGVHNTITNNTIEGNYEGGVVCTASHNIISGNNIYNDLVAGIILDSVCHENILSCNRIVGNNDGIGVFIKGGSNKNIVIDNIIKNNNIGISIQNSMKNIINGNKIEANFDIGIKLVSCEQSFITQNDIKSNLNGMQISQNSDENIIYHNNFLSNTIQVSFENSDNYWNFDYPYGGNYWSDYTGSDNYQGPEQNEPGADGIGDEAYSIEGELQEDEYPFMNTNEWITRGYQQVGNFNLGYYYISSIQTLLNGARPGDIIIADAGVYNEHLTISNSNGIVLLGASAPYTTISFTNDDVIDITADNSVLCGFTIQSTDIVDGNNVHIYSNFNKIIDTRSIGGCNGFLIDNSEGNIVCNNTIQQHSYKGITCSYADNNIICSNFIKDNGWYGINLEHSQQNLISYCLLINNFYGLRCYDSNQNILQNNTIISDTLKPYGIFLSDSNTNSVYNNKIRTYESSIYLINSYRNILNGNTLTLNTYGMFLTHFSDYHNENTIKGNIIYENNYGLYLEGGSTNFIIGNNISKNTVDGMYLESFSCANTLRGNICYKNGRDGIHLYDWCYYNDIIGNNLQKNLNTGIFLSDCPWNHIIRNNLRKNTNYGIHLERSDANTLKSNKFYDTKIAIFISGCSGNTFEKDDIYMNDYGVRLNEADDNVFTGLGLWENTYGFSLQASDSNDFIYNSIIDNSNGITITSSNQNTIDKNNIIENYNGMYITSSNQNMVTWNNITNNTNYVLRLENGANQNTVSSNTIANNTGSAIESLSSSGNLYNLNTIKTNNEGIKLLSSQSETITDNIFTHNGIILRGTLQANWDTHTIQNNIADGKPIYYLSNAYGGNIPSDAAQVILASCSQMTMNNFYITNQSEGFQIGYSSNINISSSQITSCENGIYLYNSYDSSIYENTLTDNTGVSIVLQQSNNNIVQKNWITDNDNGILVIDSQAGVIFNNYFLYNQQQAFDVGQYDWYSQQYGGNYWSDYTGTDENHDGYGDTPYSIPPQPRYDQLPLYNNPPNIPSSPDPPDGATDVNRFPLLLSWIGGDFEGDAVTYEVYFGLESPPPLVSSNQTETSYFIPYILLPRTTYYWQIVAWDNTYRRSTQGPLWSFTTQMNHPPFEPTNPVPANGAVDIDIENFYLIWDGGDPDSGDMVMYYIFFGTETNPPNIGMIGPLPWCETPIGYYLGNLTYDTTYYWRIEAWDLLSEATYGPLWSFSTKEAPNQPPFTPSNPLPFDGETDVDVDADLSWIGDDPDPGDTVTYDIYFGTNSPPDLVVSGHPDTMYDPGTLRYSTTYYWQIVSIDNHDAMTSGPIWSFTTASIEGWPMFRCEPQHMAYTDEDGPLTNHVLWAYTTGNNIYSSPAVYNGKVYVGSLDHNVYCFYGNNGTKIWEYLTGDIIRSSPAVVDGRVYIGSNDYNVYCLNATDGSPIWSYHATGKIYESSPVVSQGVVYFGAGNARIYALNALNGSFIWSYLTGGSVTSSPAVAYGRVYVGSYDHKVHALYANNGTKAWEYTTGNITFSSPAVFDGKVYIGSLDHNVYALNAFNGTLQWTFPTGGDVYSSPAVANGTVFVGSDSRNFYALNATNGQQRWSVYTGGLFRSSPAVTNNVVYVGGFNQKVYAFNITNGQELWRYDGTSSFASSPAIANGVLYIGCNDYKIYAFETPPSWRNQGENKTTIQPIECISLFAQGKDDIALNWAWLSTNETGIWQNFTGTGPWWDYNWAYHTSLPINNPQNSYQMKIVVGKTTGGTVTCNGHCRDDFSDIRFLDADHITPLSYWMENHTSGTQATFWVKTSADAQTDQMLYMYYGNPTAVTTSNGDTTFILFDHFNDGILDASKWDTGGSGTYSESGTTLTLTANPSGTNRWVASKITYAVPCAVEALAKTTTTSTGVGSLGMTRQQVAPANNDITVAWYYHNLESTFQFNSGNDITFNMGSMGIAKDTNYHRSSCKRTGTNDTFVLDASIRNGAYPTANNRYVNMQVFYNSGPSEQVIDWIALRMYHASEPTWATPGTPEVRSNAGYYGSPMKMQENSQWQWSNFTWHNPDVLPGTVVGWKIYYNDTSGNINCTNIMSFFIAEQPEIDPDRSFVTLTNENMPFLVTCPAGDGPIYQHVKVTCKNANGDPLPGILPTAFVFTINPTGGDTHYWGTLSCTFTAVDTQTNANGEIRFTVKGGTSIYGNITIQVNVYGVPINDIDTLTCKTPDYDTNGVVSLGDFVIFARDYGKPGWRSDFTGDGMVSLGDFVLFAQHYAH